MVQHTESKRHSCRYNDRKIDGNLVEQKCLPGQRREKLIAWMYGDPAHAGTRNAQ